MNMREAAYKHFMQEEMRIGKSYQDVFNAGFQAGLASQAQQSQWISVEEAKATLKDGDLIFAYCEFYGVIEATYAFEEGYYNPHRIVKKNGDSYRINTFTHFMVRKPTSLPPSPEGE